MINSFHEMEGCSLQNEWSLNNMPVVFLENKWIKIGILMGRGSDIFEFTHKKENINLLLKLDKPIHNPREYISQRRDTLNQFEDYYYGGWQEILPNSQPLNYRGASLGQHGEVWLNSWQYSILKNTNEEVSVKCWYRPLRIPLYVEKILTIKFDEPTLFIEEVLTNEASTTVSYMWGHHIAFGLPFLTHGAIVSTNARSFEAEPAMPAKRRFKSGETYDWPMVMDLNNQQTDAQIVPKAGDFPYSELAYLSDFEENAFYTLSDADKKITFRLDWERDNFPYIWFWQERYGILDAPWWGKAYSIALEPWTNKWSANPEKDIEMGLWPSLEPQESRKTSLKATILLNDKY